VDPLSRLLDDVRPRGALFDRSWLPSPWSLRFDEGAPLSLVTMLRGDGWVQAGGGAPLRIGRGDVAILVGSRPYDVADQPGAPPQMIVRGDRCTTADGRTIDDVPDLCSDRWDAATSTSVVLKGAFGTQSGVGDRALHGLPPVLTVAADALPAPTIDTIAQELARDRPGQQAVLERLLEVLLVTALREWLDRPDSEPPAWYRAQADPVVGPALDLLHRRPAEPWTVTSLARHVAVSRSTFARRFTDLVGAAPIAYLASWRICLAGDLLRGTDESVGAIAARVGYANAYTLSSAFVRHHGVRPTTYRRAARAALAALAAPATAGA
jgi:AraC-like DNA-binding protein